MGPTSSDCCKLWAVTPCCPLLAQSRTTVGDGELGGSVALGRTLGAEAVLTTGGDGWAALEQPAKSTTTPANLTTRAAV